MSLLSEAVELLQSSSHTTAFTGAGISVESGIPPFRGQNGLWNKYNPRLLEINYFYEHPVASWELNKKVFYQTFAEATPNKAHKVIAYMEDTGLIQAVITQNIDNLHHKAGSENIYEFHGNSRELVCTNCKTKYEFRSELIENLPPKCNKCQGVLKPNFIFFGEPIPEPARTLSFKEAEKADVFLVIGTTGEVQPASFIPIKAKDNGGRIIEVNTEKSAYTDDITDVFLKGKATIVMDKLSNLLYN